MSTHSPRSTPARRARASVAWLSALPLVVAAAFGCAALTLLGLRLTDTAHEWSIAAEPGVQTLADPLDVPRRPQRVELLVRSTHTARAATASDGVHRPWDVDGDAASPVASLAWLTGVDDALSIDVLVDGPSPTWAFGRSRTADTLLCTLRDDGWWACGFEFFTHDGSGPWRLQVTLDGDAAGLASAAPRLVVRPHPGYQRVNDLAMAATGLFALLFGVAGARGLRPRGWT